MEPTPGPERISRRLREQFAPAYLAITGLVQVLVLDALISKVEGNYTEYGVVDWLVAAATFLVCVDIWHEYLMTVLSHVWLPGLLDSLVPFAFLVTELLMVHFVGDDLRGWLLGYGLVALIGVAAWAQRNLRIRQFADEERDLHLAVVTRHWYRAALAVAVTAFGLLGWLLYDALGLDSAQLAVAAAALVGVVVIIASSVPMWNQILRYARGHLASPIRLVERRVRSGLDDQRRADRNLGPRVGRRGVAVVAAGLESADDPQAPEMPCHPRRSTRGWEETGSPTRSSARAHPT